MPVPVTSVGATGGAVIGGPPGSGIEPGGVALVSSVPVPVTELGGTGGVVGGTALCTLSTAAAIPAPARPASPANATSASREVNRNAPLGGFIGVTNIPSQ